MTKPRKKRRPSLFRRLVYFLMLLTGGGAGVGGWVFKDHPMVQAVWTLVTGKPPANGRGPDLDRSMTNAVVDLLQPSDSFREPGTYQVTIRQVHLDPNLFTAGHTVDIQAKVLKRDGQGRITTLWETDPFGERLAVAGKDELIAEWDHRPFQVEWSPGDRLTVEVYDRRAGLFAQPKRFFLAPSDAEPREFPLKPGTFPLEAQTQKPDPRVDPRNLNIVLQSQRVGDLRGQDRVSEGSPSQPRTQAQSQLDDHPIIIK
jgi:hypothetical protein